MANVSTSRTASEMRVGDTQQPDQEPTKCRFFRAIAVLLTGPLEVHGEAHPEPEVRWRTYDIHKRVTVEPTDLGGTVIVNVERQDRSVGELMRWFASDRFLLDPAPGLVNRDCTSHDAVFLIRSLLSGVPLMTLVMIPADLNTFKMIAGAGSLQAIAAFVNAGRLIGGFEFARLSRRQRRMFLDLTIQVLIFDADTPAFILDEYVIRTGS